MVAVTCNSVGGGDGGNIGPSVSVKARVVNLKQLDVVASRSSWLSWNALIAHCTRRYAVHLVRRGSERQFSKNSAHKDRRAHCKILRWQCWFSGSQHRGGGKSSVVVTLESAQRTHGSQTGHIR